MSQECQQARPGKLGRTLLWCDTAKQSAAHCAILPRAYAIRMHSVQLSLAGIVWHTVAPSDSCSLCNVLTAGAVCNTSASICAFVYGTSHVSVDPCLTCQCPVWQILVHFGSAYRRRATNNNSVAAARARFGHFCKVQWMHGHSSK